MQYTTDRPPVHVSQQQISELRAERDELTNFVRAALPELKDSPLAIAGYALLETIDRHARRPA